VASGALLPLAKVGSSDQFLSSGAAKNIDAATKYRLHDPMKTTAYITVLLGLATIAVCMAGDGKIEQALRDLDTQWSAAAQAKDLDKTVSYYASDALILPPNGAAAHGREAARKVWKEVFDATVNGSWKPGKVDVAKSGDIGYISGTYDWTSKDASGKTSKDRGKYLEVLKRQSDGTWKCVADCWNSDLPAPGSSPAPGMSENR